MFTGAPLDAGQSKHVTEQHHCLLQMLNIKKINILWSIGVWHVGMRAPSQTNLTFSNMTRDEQPTFKVEDKQLVRIPASNGQSSKTITQALGNPVFFYENASELSAFP